MVPQILQLLNGQNNPQIQQLRQMIGAIRSASDPNALLQQMLQRNNPAFAQALDYVKQNGNDPKAAFEKLAKDRGIDPAELGL